MGTTEQICIERFKLQEEFLGADKTVNRIEPIVSVVVMTYQHIGYIKDCLDGILMQETTYPFEVIVGEDGSTDGTADICKEYAEKHPDKIRLFIRDRKLSQYIDEQGNTRRFNGLWAKMSARGKYIAFCEGDDYWTNPHKLQKQVDFLERNDDYGLVYTNVDFYFHDEGRLEKDYITSGKLQRSTNFAEHLYNAGYIAPCTWVYRKKYMFSYEKLYVDGTFPLALDIWADSKVHFLNETTATYRILKESASHSQSLKRRYLFGKGIFEIQKEYIDKYEVGDKIKYLIYQKAFLMLFPGALIFDDCEVVNNAVNFWKGNLRKSVKERLFLLLSKQPVITKSLFTIIYKFKRVVI